MIRGGKNLIIRKIGMIEVINEIRTNLLKATDRFTQRVNSTRGMYGVIGLNIMMLLGASSLLLTLPISAPVLICSAMIVILCTGLSIHVVKEHLAIKKHDVVFNAMVLHF